MTQDDYKLIAQAVAHVRDSAGWALIGEQESVAKDAIDAVATRLAADMAKKDQHFDVDRFLSDCK